MKTMRSLRALLIRKGVKQRKAQEEAERLFESLVNS